MSREPDPDPVHPHVSAPRTADGEKTPSEGERGGDRLPQGQAALQPATGDPPPSETFRNLQVPWQYQQSREHRGRGQPGTRDSAWIQPEPHQAGSPDEDEEVVSQQSGRAGKRQQQDAHRPRASIVKPQAEPCGGEAEEPEQGIHPPFDRVVQADGSDAVEQNGDEGGSPSAEAPTQQIEQREGRKRADHGEQSQVQVRRPEGTGPAVEEQVIERGAGVGEQNGTDHTGCGRWWVLVLEIAAPVGCRLRAGRLDEVAQRRHGFDSRMLQAVPGGHGQ